MFSVALDASTLYAHLDALPGAVHVRLKTAVTTQALLLEGLVKQKLSGQVLNVRTGALRASIFNEVTDGETRVEARVASSGDVKYAAIQEFGGTTPPHEIVPVKAAVLAFTMGGQDVFARVVHHPGSKIPERSYMRSSLEDRAEEITSAMREAVLQGAREAFAR